MSVSTNTKRATGGEDRPAKANSALPDTEEDLSRSSPQSLDISGESVDFNSILSAISGNSEQSVPGEKETDNPPGHKNLNISSVIAEIQDEGPAGKLPESGRMKDPAAQRDTSGQGHDAGQQAASTVVQEREDKPVSAQTPAAEKSAENAFQPSQPSSVSWQRILERLLLAVLMVTLVAVGYFLHRNENATEMLLAETARLAAEQQSLKGEIRALRKQYQQKQPAPPPKQAEQQPATPPPSAGKRQHPDAWLPAGFHVSQRPLAVMIAGVTASVTKKAPTENVSARDGQRQEVPKPQPVPKAGRAGQWTVHLASSSNRKKAEKLLAVYARKAPDAVIRAATVKGRKLYRVSVPGFERKSEALDYQKSISHELGLKGVWIERNKSSRKSAAKH